MKALSSSDNPSPKARFRATRALADACAPSAPPFSPVQAAPSAPAPDALPRPSPAWTAASKPVIRASPRIFGDGTAPEEPVCAPSPWPYRRPPGARPAASGRFRPPPVQFAAPAEASSRPHTAPGQHLRCPPSRPFPLPTCAYPDLFGSPPGSLRPVTLPRATRSSRNLSAPDIITIYIHGPGLPCSPNTQVPLPP